jgi:pimeloyl-ACP methyl ester carboxylesterase
MFGSGGEPLVLLHGLSGSTRWWVRNASALAEAHRVHVLNLPGFGDLPWRSPRFVLTEAADWVADWLAAVGLDACHLVGHSMGGYIAIRLAARRPECVRRLVLVSPAGVPTGRSMLGYGVPLVAAALAADPTFLPVLAIDALRAGPLTILRAARDLLGEDVRDDLNAIRAPTLLVWGERDTLVPPSIGPAMRDEIRDARLVLLTGAGHVPQFDRADEFNSTVLRFLAGSDGPARGRGRPACQPRRGRVCGVSPSDAASSSTARSVLVGCPEATPACRSMFSTPAPPPGSDPVGWPGFVVLGSG